MKKVNVINETNRIALYVAAILVIAFLLGLFSLALVAVLIWMGVL